MARDDQGISQRCQEFPRSCEVSGQNNSLFVCYFRFFLTRASSKALDSRAKSKRTKIGGFGTLSEHAANEDAAEAVKVDYSRVASLCTRSWTHRQQTD